MPRVLIIEDNPDLAELARVVVERAGHAASVAYSAEEALAALARERFDVALVDNVMPGGMDGNALVRAIKANPAWAGLPLIAVTAKVLPRELAEMRRSGVDAIVAKPYRHQVLREAIARAVGSESVIQAHANGPHLT